MKNLTISTCLFLAMFGLAKPVQATETRIRQISISDEVVPGEFQRDSDAYVVLSVHLAGCDHWNAAQVNELPDSVTEVSAFATETTGQLCPMIVRIVQQEVGLGKLSPGFHHIRFMNLDGSYVEKDLKIE